MEEIKTLNDAWQVLTRHGLEGIYCPHCDQFSQARVLLKQDEIISDLYEACKTACASMTLKYASDGDKDDGYIEVKRNYGGGQAYAYRLMREALAKKDKG